jgi:ABC-type antimicrobial peptide transport system permease subunit
VQQQLKPLGIDMQVQNFEYATLLSKCETGEPAAFFGTDDIYGVVSSRVHGVKLDVGGNVMLQAATLAST